MKCGMECGSEATHQVLCRRGGERVGFFLSFDLYCEPCAQEYAERASRYQPQLLAL